MCRHFGASPCPLHSALSLLRVAVGSLCESDFLTTSTPANGRRRNASLKTPACRSQLLTRNPQFTTKDTSLSCEAVHSMCPSTFTFYRTFISSTNHRIYFTLYFFYKFFKKKYFLMEYGNIIMVIIDIKVCQLYINNF